MAMIDKNKSSKVKIRNNKMKNIIIYATVVGVFLIGMISVITYANAFKKEVQVVSFSESAKDRQLVEEVLLKAKPVSQKSYNDDMILWEDREEYIGKYTGNFIRKDTEVYKDMFVDEPVIRTAYLYNLDSDEELVTFPYEIAQAGGKLVTPGDRLRVRGSYKVEGSNTGGVVQEEDVASDIIFDVVEVQDLLNSDNESIVDIIADANKLPASDRETLMTSEDFINKVTPKAILMVVKTKDINTYVEFQARENPQYTITILTRNEELKSNELNTGNSLLQLLNSVQQGASEVPTEVTQ